MNEEERLKEYIENDLSYRDWKKDNFYNASDFDKFCVEHCKDIETILNENKELEEKVKQYEHNELAFHKEIYNQEQLIKDLKNNLKLQQILNKRLIEEENNAHTRNIKAIEYLTSYQSIHTIQFGNENDDSYEENKQLDEKTLTEMTNRYLKVHDKLLEILEKKEVE